MEISDQTTSLDPYFASFEDSLSAKNYKPDTLANYRYLLRRFGRLLETEGIAPSALTPELAVELGDGCRSHQKPDQGSQSCQAVCRASD